MPKKATTKKVVPIKLPKGQKMSDEDILVEDDRPVPEKWVKVTLQQVKDAQKAGKLYGFDDRNMTALIRG